MFILFKLHATYTFIWNHSQSQVWLNLSCSKLDIVKNTWCRSVHLNRNAPSNAWLQPSNPQAFFFHVCNGVSNVLFSFQVVCIWVYASEVEHPCRLVSRSYEHNVLRRSVPYHEPDRLLVPTTFVCQTWSVWRVWGLQSRDHCPIPGFRDWNCQSRDPGIISGIERHVKEPMSTVQIT